MCFAPFSHCTCSNRWKCMKHIENQLKSVKIYEHPWTNIKNHENIWNPWKCRGCNCVEKGEGLHFIFGSLHSIVMDLHLFVMSLPVFWMPGPACVFFVWFCLVSGPIQKGARRKKTWILAVLRPPDLLPGPDWWPKPWMVWTAQMSILLILISLLAVPRQ